MTSTGPPSTRPRKKRTKSDELHYNNKQMSHTTSTTTSEIITCKRQTCTLLALAAHTRITKWTDDCMRKLQVKWQAERLDAIFRFHLFMLFIFFGSFHRCRCPFERFNWIANWRQKKQFKTFINFGSPMRCDEKVIFKVKKLSRKKY